MRRFLILFAALLPLMGALLGLHPKLHDALAHGLVVLVAGRVADGEEHGRIGP